MRTRYIQWKTSRASTVITRVPVLIRRLHAAAILHLDMDLYIFIFIHQKW